MTSRTVQSAVLPFDPFAGDKGPSWAAAQLQDAGLRVTALRIAAIRLLAGRTRRWTAAEAFDELRSEMPISDRSSVTRTLVMLNAAGLSCREDHHGDGRPERWAWHTDQCQGCLAPVCP